MTRANAERISASFKAQPLVVQTQYRYEMSLAQMASEAYNLRPGMTDAELTRQLKIGNSVPALNDPEQRIGNQRLTDSQITDFNNTYTIVATSSESSAAGDYALLLERNDHTGFVYAFRSTQPLSQQYNNLGNGGWEQDSANNRQMSDYGVGYSQLDNFERFVTRTAPLLNGSPAVCAGGSLSGHQCLAIIESHPEIFQEGDLPNVIQNPTGAATFSEGKTVLDALTVYRNVLADPWSASSLPGAPAPGTPEWDSYIQAQEAACRFKVAPSGADAWDSDAVWRVDDAGNRIPQVEQSRPDVQFAAMVAQAETTASFSLNIVQGQYDPALNHTIVLESQNQPGFNASVVSAMGVHPSLENLYNVPVPGMSLVTGNPLDAVIAFTRDGHITESDIGPSHGFSPPVDSLQMRTAVQHLIPELTDEQWGQMVQGATSFSASPWTGSASPQATESQLWPRVLGHISEQTGGAISFEGSALPLGTPDAPFNYENRNAISADLSTFLNAWEASGKPTFRAVALTDAFSGPSQPGEDRSTAAYFDVRAKLDAASPVERVAMVKAIKTGSSVALLPIGEVPDGVGTSEFDASKNDALIGDYVQTMRERNENWNTEARAPSVQTDSSARETPPTDGSLGAADVPSPIQTSPILPADESDRAFVIPPESDGGNGLPLLDISASVPDSSSPSSTTTAPPRDEKVASSASRPPDPSATAIASGANLILAIQSGNSLAAVMAGMSLLNSADKAMGGAGQIVPGELSSTLGALSAGLNFVSALERGDAGGIVISGVSLVDSLTGGQASIAIGEALGMSAINVLPYLGIVNGLANGDTVSTLAAAANLIPVYGQLLSVCIVILGTLMASKPDIPTAYGDAQVQWDETGGVTVVTTRDEAGGGAFAAIWMKNLMSGLDGELATRTDESGLRLYGIDPARMPRIGYAFDPDTGDGYLRLTWLEPDGTEAWRQYDTSGNRQDAQSQEGINDLARDFYLHVGEAIVPAWEAQGVFEQHEAGVDTPRPGVFVGEVSADGATVTRSVLTLGSEQIISRELDLDGDGYLEDSEWTTASLLAVDLNGDGKVFAGELVDGRLDGHARNSLASLDTNHDGVLDSRDLAFTALRIWTDANSDGVVDDEEVEGLAASGIAAIDYTGESPTLTRSDGSTAALARQELTSDTQGVARTLSTDGLYEAYEQGDIVLHAINQHIFDSDPTHLHGGEANLDARGEIIIDAGDERIQSTGPAMLAPRPVQTHVEGDALLRDAGVGSVQAGQGAGSLLGSEAALTVVSALSEGREPKAPGNLDGQATIRVGVGDLRVRPTAVVPASSCNGNLVTPFAFVPASTSTVTQAMQQVTRDMLRNAGSSLFGTGGSPLATLAVAALPLELPELVTGFSVEDHPEALPDSLDVAVLRDSLAAPRVSTAIVSQSAINGVGDPVVFVEAVVTPASAAPYAAPQSVPVTVAPSQPSGSLRSVPSLTVSAAMSNDVTYEPMAVPLLDTVSAMTFVNSPPVAVGDFATGDEDRSILVAPGDLLANDRDADVANVGQVLTVTVLGNARHGSVQFTADGFVRFTPDTDYFGPAGFDYTISDGAQGESTAAFEVMLQPVNDVPEALSEATVGFEDRRVLIDPADLLANDRDVDNTHGELFISALGGGRHGTLAWTSGPDDREWIAFTPDADFHGVASFDYVVSDGAGGIASATATLDIAPVNDTPLLGGDVTTVPEDTGLFFSSASLLANDGDADGDVLTIIRVGNSVCGAVSLDGAGKVRFVPDADYVGPAGFDYWVVDAAGAEAKTHVAIDVMPVNDLPVPAPDTLGDMVEDRAIDIAPATLLANDSDIEAAASLSVTAVADAQHGSAVLLPDGTIRFTLEADYSGLAGFRYTVTDSDGGSASAMAMFAIMPVADAPLAADESATGHEDHELVFPAAQLLINDVDADLAYGDSLAITGVTVADPLSGRAFVDTDGAVHFVPATDYSGPAAFTYRITDSFGLSASATVRLTLLPINDAPRVGEDLVTGTEDTRLRFDPALLLANDSDVDNPHADLSISGFSEARHGAVRWTDTGDGRRIEFIPDADYSGVAGFDYEVDDGAGGATSARVSIHVEEVNDAPVAYDDAVGGLEDLPLVLGFAELGSNDGDVDGDPLVVTAVGNARYGSVAIVGTQVVFTPDADYSGAAGFDYTVSDQRGGLASAHVDLNFAAVNDAPAVNDEMILGSEDAVLLIDPAVLLANDTDRDSPIAGLHVMGVGDAAHGTVAMLNDGTIRFVPDADFDGAASFHYTVADDEGATMTGTATVQLAGVNDAPVTYGESIAIDEDTVLTLKTALLANDADVDTPHGALGIVGVGAFEHCTASLSADGSVSFVPEPDYSGAASFDYTVGDGAGGSATATARFVIAPVNDAPRVRDESVVATEDSILHFSTSALLANDTDIETPVSLSVSAVGGAQGGWVSLAGEAIRFTPQADYSGLAYFSYTVHDPDGGVSLGRVNINYLPVNDAPVASGELIWSRQNVTTTLTQAALLANDHDTEGSLVVAGVDNAVGGTVSLNGDGSVSFRPDAGYSGRASFDYVVRDDEGATARATAQIDFSRPNLNPVGIDDSFDGDEDVVFHIATAQLLANDSDRDDPEAISVVAVSGAMHGSVRLDTVTQTVIFSPDKDYNGPAQFEYTVADPYGGSTQATAFLNIRPVNDAPVIQRIEEFVPDALDVRWVINEANGVREEEVTTSFDEPYRASGRVVAYDPDGDALSFSVLGTGPNHGKAWVNQYAAARTTAGVDEVGQAYGGTFVLVFETVWVSETGTWQYYSKRGDPYNGTDPFVIRVSDDQGGATDAVIDTTHKGSTIRTGGGAGCPVVLDLDGDGIELLCPEDSSMFADINGDGQQDRIGWIAPDDAVLACDANGDGRIDVLDEVSFVKYKDGAHTDLDGLAGLDSSGDGVISCADDVWARLGIVKGGARQDDQGEVGTWMSLDDAGITSIGLDRQDAPHLDHGNVVFGTSVVTFADGHSAEAGDVAFAGVGIPLPDAALALVADHSDAGIEPSPPVRALSAGELADIELARIRQQALLFNQVSATDEAEAPVAYVPPPGGIHDVTGFGVDGFVPAPVAELVPG